MARSSARCWRDVESRLRWRGSRPDRLRNPGSARWTSALILVGGGNEIDCSDSGRDRVSGNDLRLCPGHGPGGVRTSWMRRSGCVSSAEEPSRTDGDLSTAVLEAVESPRVPPLMGKRNKVPGPLWPPRCSTHRYDGCGAGVQRLESVDEPGGRDWNDGILLRTLRGNRVAGPLWDRDG